PCFTLFPYTTLFRSVLGGLFALGAVVDAMGLFKHGRDMAAAEHEGAASHYIQRTTFGKTYLLRNGLLGFVVLGALALALSGASGDRKSTRLNSSHVK